MSPSGVMQWEVHRLKWQAVVFYVGEIGQLCAQKRRVLKDPINVPHTASIMPYR